MFIDGLSRLNNGDGDGCMEQMKTVVEKYPQSEVAEMAGMIVKGVQEGRRLHGGKFDLGDVWSRRDITLSSDSTVADTLSEERNAQFLFILTYHPDTLALGLSDEQRLKKRAEDQLLFEMARYNFSNFLVRNFDLQVDDDEGLRRMLVSGFLNYDEALQYARKLYAEAPDGLASLLCQCRTIIISEPNLRLLGTHFSYEDYDQFYRRIFMPMEISNEELLLQPDSVEQPDEDEDTNAEEEEPTQKSSDFDFDDDFF